MACMCHICIIYSLLANAIKIHLANIYCLLRQKCDLHWFGGCEAAVSQSRQSHALSEKEQPATQRCVRSTAPPLPTRPKSCHEMHQVKVNNRRSEQIITKR